MEIWIDATNEAHLQRPGDFTEFAVVVDGSTLQRAAPALRALGVLEREHVFIEQARLTGHAGAAVDDPSWRREFGAMVAYAASKGQVDAAGRIRAHIRVSDSPPSRTVEQSTCRAYGRTLESADRRPRHPKYNQVALSNTTLGVLMAIVKTSSIVTRTIPIPPELVKLRLHVRRRDLLGGILHEYHHAA